MVIVSSFLLADAWMVVLFLCQVKVVIIGLMDYVDDPKTAHVLYFNTLYEEYKYDTSLSRSMGCFIRPVYPKK